METVQFERGGMKMDGEDYWFCFWPDGILMIFRDTDSCCVWAAKQGLTPVFEKNEPADIQVDPTSA